MEVKEEKKKVLLTHRSDFPGRPCMFHSYSWLHKVTLKNKKYIKLMMYESFEK